MSGILRLPLIPILIALIIGLYIGQFDPPFIFEWRFHLFSFLLILWGLFLFKKSLLISFWLGLFFFLIFGIISTQSYLHPFHSRQNLSNFYHIDPVIVEGIVDRTPHRTHDKIRLIIHSEKVILPDRIIPVRDYLLIHINEKDEPVRLGDRLRFWCKLKPPRGFRNPGGFSYERYLAYEKIYTVGFLKSNEGWIKIGVGLKHPFLIKMETWRENIRNFLDKESHPLCSGIFKALVLGEQEHVPEDLKEAFINTGIAHLLAISGDHLGIVALLSFSLLLWILKNSEFLLLTIDVKKLAACMTIPCIVLYTFIAGGGISVIRATLMVCIFFLSIIFGRERNLLYTLALSAFIILIFSPPSLFDVSFQLSFLAVFSILYLAPWIFREISQEDPFRFKKEDLRKKIWKYIKISFLITTVATLGTAPFVLLHFNRISPIGIFTNLFAIPWVGFLIVPLSLIASILSFFFYPLATILMVLNNIITLGFLKVIAFFSSIPYASIFISTPTAFEIILFYILLFSLAHIRKSRNLRYIFLALIMIFIFDFFYWEVKGFFKKDLTINFIDVGHGDSILIEFPKGKRMLVDGGGLYEDSFDIGKNVIAPFLWKKKINSIDFLVLTHPDPDHFKGLKFIVSQFSIGQFWDNGLRERSEAYIQLEQVIQEKNLNRISKNEESFSISIGGVKISFLNPPKLEIIAHQSLSRSDVNNLSLVMKLEFKNFSALLTGDIEKEAEYRLIKKGYSIKSHLLKIPHHGSLSSSSRIFVENVKPAFALLSVANHGLIRLPHPEVINRYKEIGSMILRTDEHGAIEITTNGENISIHTFTSFHPHLHQTHLQKNLLH
jgi:competence protein ComEC